MRLLLASVLLSLALLTGCGSDKPGTTAVESAAVETPAEIVVDVRESIQLALTDDVPKAVERIDPSEETFNACAVALMTRWEVSGEAVYTRKWQGVIYPGGASGPTWGIGYDGGHQTRLDIARDWADHRDKVQLVNTSGVTGSTAKARIGEWRTVRTPYLQAATVFAAVSLPQYTKTARRAFGPGFADLPPHARCALVSLVYNRGGQMTGSRRAEMRTMRDICIPAGDVACIAAEFRSMKRLWPNVRGLRDRREDEARVAMGA